ncbi:pyrroline-5-carboxylate reductase family protein [Methanobacterium petrolearium]|uniref:pyrroline-5-carboxylate reductase family protein n=1 Tax=Methanobacterium petrolearium TaxID=710190 RepID=UPI001AE7A5E5|nr:pyrroline-5-carboxylate reductase dimerization domain-containing protein [Methanobacterium petrolearium]MBP1946517.1 pyrroline-5-carboxylate reductase [Methanobacterium petrolearium]BDZ69859.1 pyrroline-5-carboxylate reductase 3 [Methanobacterium petrolearium]
MEKIGFIGYGAMGSMIIRGILRSGVLKESEMIISTRSLNKLSDLQKSHPEIEIAQSNKTVAEKSQKIFLFIKTGQVKESLEEINDHTSVNTHIICIAAGLTIENIEKVFPGKISKVIPSLTSEVNEGISLVAHNLQVTPEDAEFVEKIFQSIGEVKIVNEKEFPIATNLTSSAPAFISFIIMKFTESALEHDIFTRKEAEEMVTETLYGTAKLLQEKDLTFEDVIRQVATKGGITEEGLKVLDQGLTPLFDELFASTLKKYEKVETQLDNEYEN